MNTHTSVQTTESNVFPLRIEKSQTLESWDFRCGLENSEILQIDLAINPHWKLQNSKVLNF